MARTETTLALVNDLGTTPVTAYTVPASTRTIVTGILISNIAGANRDITLVIDRGAVEYSIFEAVQVARDSTLEFSGHIILDTAGDDIIVTANVASSFDIVISGWENT